MKKAIVGCVVLLVLSISAAVGAQDKNKDNSQDASSNSKFKWSPDDIIMSQFAGAFRVSPDCKWAVWVMSSGDKEKDQRTSNIYLSSLTDKKITQLTRGVDNNSNPRWSPDGQLIAFVSNRKAPGAKPAGEGEDGPQQQIWLMSPFGGEPWPLTESKRSIGALEWAGPDTIIYAAEEAPTLYEETIKKDKDSSVVVEDEQHAPPVRLFMVSTKDKKVTRLTDNTDRIAGFDLSPDGTKAVTVHDRSLRFIYDNKIKPVVFLYDLKNGTRKQIFSAPEFNVEAVHWAPDGSGFYASSAYTHDPEYLDATISELYYYDLATGNPSKVDLGWDNGLSDGFQATPDGVIVSLANGARDRVAKFKRQGTTWTREFLTGEHANNIFGFAAGKDGKTIVYRYTTASTPAQWFRAELDGTNLGSPFQITDLNPGFKDKPKAKTEVIQWKGSNDDPIEGILYYPDNYEAGKKYPLVLMIHGGPAGADFDAWDDSWAYPANLMTERGAFVLKPNYHGSSNYGLKFVESIGHGKYYDLEVPDIEKGVDYVIAKGLVDPDKLSTLGWSNGSILTIALTVNSTRYKVASAGAGDVEWISDWGNAHFGASFDNYYFGASPLQNPKLYIDKSPFFKMDRVRTPTIIYFGTVDTNVPTEQGWLHYRALQQIGKVPVKFILFPGEPHSPRKLTHQRRKVEEDLKWFDTYLFHTEEPENEALKPDSPLAMELKLKAAKSERGRFGVTVNGALAPETVDFKGIQVGRFEVTRAQFAQFDKAYRVEPGKENYPANNITLDQARAYCGWLSKQTGKSYRLPDEKEAGQLYGAASPGENTLDYWAGYSVNFDDATRLSPKLKELGPGALLKEVGSFKGAGTPQPVFDLGGNVAEWVVLKDGTGQPRGGSADTPADGKLKGRTASSDYTGFRVIVETSSAAQAGR
ncbi:MAG: prolyl oligopeptidase family serine peptidase [Blastocatellia bacterium]